LPAQALVALSPRPLQCSRSFENSCHAPCRPLLSNRRMTVPPVIADLLEHDLLEHDLFEGDMQ
jgi:hypothetical protein